MKPSSFEYKRPASIAEALNMLSDFQDQDVRLLAGGQSLVPMMNFRMAAPEILIDLGSVPELVGIEKESNFLNIGAMTTATNVMSDDLVVSNAPLVPIAYEHVAHRTIRNRGTLGGNLCNCDPASEMPLVMLVLKAELIVASKRGTRRVAAEDFFQDLYTTAVESDEILTRIRVPCAEPGARFAFHEVSLRKGDFAIVSVAASMVVKDGICEDLCVGLCGVGNVAIRVEGLASLAKGCMVERIPTDEIVERALSQVSFEATASITAAYRRDVASALVRRVVECCKKERAV